MTTEQSDAPQAIEGVKKPIAVSKGEQDAFSKILADKGIDKIVIIDDAYDKYPYLSDFDKAELNEFLAEINSDNSILELQALGFDGSDGSDIDDELMKKMWDEIQKATKLGENISKFLVPIIAEKKNQIEPFCKFLEDVLKIDVTRLGGKDDFNQVGAKLIFIDYNLGGKWDHSSAVENSQKYAERVYEKFNDQNEKPFIILMSSLHITYEKQLHFRDNSGLLGGMFFFVPKDDLDNTDKLLLKLSVVAMSLSSGGIILKFLEDFKSGLETATQEFLSQLRKLSISDFAYIQKLSLQDDGAPLGNYILWLFGEHFENLLSSKMQTKIQPISKLRFEDLPNTHFIPSLQLTDIYQSALYDHSKHGKQLKLGDIFINGEMVRMIINAECDLVAASEGNDRDISDDFNVLLIHGKLIRHSDKFKFKPTSMERTEFFELVNGGEKKIYRIIWDMKSVTSIKYKEIDQLAQQGYKMNCRLKLQFALQIQNKFASNLTRIGLPVAPPIYNPLQVELYCEGLTGMPERIITLRDNNAFLCYMKKDDQCILTDEFIFEFKTSLTKAIAILSQKLANLKTIPEMLETERTRIEKLLKAKKTTLDNMIKKPQKLFLLREPIPLPDVGNDKEYAKASIYVARNIENMSEKSFKFDKYSLVLNVMDV